MARPIADPANFGAFIRRRRINLGKSQRETAQRSHLSATRLQQLESGRLIHMVAPDVSAALSRALDLDEASLLRVAGYLANESPAPAGDAA